MKHSLLLLAVLLNVAHSHFANVDAALSRNKRSADEIEGFIKESDEEKTNNDDEDPNDDNNKSYYDFLYKRMKQAADTDDEPPRKRPILKATPYSIPGPQEPLPGRSHPGNYWPVFPFHNQYSGGVDLDPSISRHIGGDLNIAVPSWGILDIYGRFFNRIHDTTTKFGYMAQPVNMLDLDKNDFVKLMSDPSLHYNRNIQPTLPLGKLAKTYSPISCKPPMCNPYQGTFGFGVEHDVGGNDGVEGDIDVPLPISKGIAYRFPFSGKIYYDRDNVTITYGQNLNPINPYSSLFDYQNFRDPRLAIPRSKREISFSKKVWQSESNAKTYGEHVAKGFEPKAELYKSRVPGRPKTYDLMEDGDERSITIPRKVFEQLRMEEIQKETMSLWENYYPHQMQEWPKLSYSPYDLRSLYFQPMYVPRAINSFESIDDYGFNAYMKANNYNNFDEIKFMDTYNPTSPLLSPLPVNCHFPYYRYPFYTNNNFSPTY